MLALARFTLRFPKGFARQLTAFAFLSSDGEDHDHVSDNDHDNGNDHDNDNNSNAHNNDTIKTSNDNKDDVDEQSYSLDDDFEDLARAQDLPGDTPPPAWKPGSPYVANGSGNGGGDKVRLREI